MPQFQAVHRQWVEEALTRDTSARDQRWSESIAVGSGAFVDKVKAELGIKARHWSITEDGMTHTLRESEAAYTCDFPGQNSVLSLDNTVFWDKSS